MTRLLIIGGSDAGTEAALRGRECDAALEITMVVADRFVNYSICGLPFLVSGEVEEVRDLAHRDMAAILGRGIELRLEQVARAIDVDRKLVRVEGAGQVTEIAYDVLVVATGAHPVRPAIRGLDLDGVHVLHTMGDGIALRERLDRTHPRDAVVIGSGYIGVEMADALTRRDVRVTLVGRARSVLPTVDPSLGALLSAELERNGVTVLTGTEVRAIARSDGRLAVGLADGRTLGADIVVLGAGVRPNADLAAAAGAATGVAGAIRVTRKMETTLPDMYAAGDCVETWHAVLRQPTYLPLGTTAHKQGRIAGEDAAGGDAFFRGAVGTQVVVKVFELAAARTGLNDDEAEQAQFAPLTVETAVPDHKPYYPGADLLHIRVGGDARSGKLLGAQIVGHWRAEVAKRIDIAASGLHEDMSVLDLIHLDLSYTPPVSAPWDPVQVAAQAWEAAARAGAG